MEPFEPKRRAIHPSLIEPLLVLGVDRGVFYFELTSAGSLFLLGGFHWMTFVVVVFWMVVLHPVLVWMYAKDPRMTALLLRSLSGQEFYVPHARLQARSPAPKPSVPRT